MYVSKEVASPILFVRQIFIKENVLAGIFAGKACLKAVLVRILCFHLKYSQRRQKEACVGPISSEPQRSNR